MASRPAAVKSEQFDMDSFFDFNQSTTQSTPISAPASATTPRNASQDWNGFSAVDKHDERQQFNGPSHDYNLYKQQVGLPVGSMAMPSQSMFDGSGMGDVGFGYGSGIDFDTEMQLDFNSPQSAMPTLFFPTAGDTSPADTFVDPNSIGGHEEPASNVGRLWPGMHSQQAQHAAMQKAAQASAVHQRQMKLQAQHAQYRQPSTTSQTPTAPQQTNGHSKRPSHASEPHVEESISRLLSQMRQNSSAANGDDDDGSGMLPHIARMKKDEEEMDDDERLLASEEGKKLSSKERRQLRNKVSARAFRSRRKEYIGQLEGEVALKAQENQELRNENQALLQENDRYRTLIETLLRHPSFTPFINDISKDPSVLGRPSQQQQQAPQPPSQPAPQPQQAPPAPQPPQQQPPQSDAKPDFMNFDASQLQIPGQQPQPSERVGLAMIPENDFSKLNINGFNSINFNNTYGVNAYPVLQVPDGPDPAQLLADRLPRSYSTLPASAALDSTSVLAKLDGAARKLIWAEEAGY